MGHFHHHAGNRLDAGYPPRFTSRWRHGRYFAMALLAAVLALLLALVLALGLGTPGVLSRLSLGTKATAVGVPTSGLHYERILRSHAPSAIEVQFPTTLQGKHGVQVWLTGSLVGDARVNRVLPPPVAGVPARDGMVLSFNDATPGGRLWLQQLPTVEGLQHGTLRVGTDGPTMQITQLVLP